MRRLIIIVEGDTEKEFVNTVLKPYLHQHNVFSVDCFKIKHSKGGLNKYEHLKKDILNCIYESNTLVTTLVDYYALPNDFPEFEDSLSIINKNERLTFLENSIKKDINSSQNRKFENLHPYIQLHEFEALVFSSMIGIEALFTPSQADFAALNRIFTLYNNPEEINENILTAPSKRLLMHIKGYNKVIDGVLIIDEIGIETVLDKCPRFSEWVKSIIIKVSE